MRRNCNGSCPVRPVAEPGEHHRVAAVALALMPGDGLELAGIGHDDLRAEAGEKTTEPRAVRARFQRHGGGGIVREQGGQGRAIIEQGAFLKQLAGGIQDADVMAAIPEIQTDGGAPRGQPAAT